MPRLGNCTLLVTLLLYSVIASFDITSANAQQVTITAGNNDGPPQGLFDRIDTNHDHLISEEEYKLGWGLLRDTVRDNNQGGSSWFPFLSSTTGANNNDSKYKGGFWKAFTSGIAMILATEIGDKTFFIAAVLSMRQARSAVFMGAMISLYLMTAVSSAMGLVLPKLIPVEYTHFLSGVLFLYFGAKLLNDSRSMEANRVSEEFEEVEEELLHTKKVDGDPDDVENPSTPRSSKDSSNKKQTFTQIAMQAFTLTFLAEWGDRSQIATIALSSHQDPYGVTLGGCLGHTACTGLAVLGGRMLAARISEKTVSQSGGIIFLLFGVHSVFFES